MAKALPAPSLRELLSAAKLRECTPMNVTAQKFQSSYAPVCKSSARWNHRTTLPQSALRAASSLREGAGERPHNANHPPAGCFVSGRVIFGGLCGGYFSIQPGTCETARLRAIFIAPTKLKSFYTPLLIEVHSLLFLVVVGLFLGVHGFVGFSGELFYGVGWVVCGEGAAGGEA